MSQASFAGMESDVGGSDDHWQTPAWATQAVLPLIPQRVADYVSGDGCALLEPSCGRGAILEETLGWLRPKSWFAFELDRCRFDDMSAKLWSKNGTVACADFLSADLAWAARLENPLVVIGNPPFSLATEFVEKCLRLADAPIYKPRKGVVALLLPLAFCTGVDRCERIHDKWKGSLYPLKRRPKFGNDSTGSRDFCWMTWDLAEPKSEWRPIG